jgi:hypothetical protein
MTDVQLTAVHMIDCCTHGCRYLFNLQKARFTNTSMACSGIIRPYNVTTNASCSNPDACKTPQTFGDKATAQMLCSDEQVLPCFLRFSDEQLPLDDASNMRCRYILRKLPQQAKQDCAEASGMYGLGPDADEVMPDIVRDAQQQQWMLDPMYFQYRGCSCLTVSGACCGCWSLVSKKHVEEVAKMDGSSSSHSDNNLVGCHHQNLDVTWSAAAALHMARCCRLLKASLCPPAGVRCGAAVWCGWCLLRTTYHDAVQCNPASKGL